MDLFLLSYRTGKQALMKYTPFELMYGQNGHLPIDVDLEGDEEPATEEERGLFLDA